MKAVIVGAGMAGSALASALLKQRPDLELVVVDAPGEAMRGASGIPAALCHPLTGWSLQRWAVRSAEVEASLEWLEERCGQATQIWSRSPLVRPLPDDDRGHRLLRSFHRVGPTEVEFLKPDAVKERFAGVGRAELGALVCPEAVCVDGGELCQRIRGDLERRGVAYIDAVVRSVDDSGVVLENGTRIATSRVAVCAGAHSGRLVPSLGQAKRYFGELLFLDAPPPKFVVAGGCHIAPAPDGSTVVGSTWWPVEEQTGSDKAALEVASTRLLERAAALMPRLRGHRVIARWGGLRGTFEGGASTDKPFWANSTGHVFAMAGFGATGLSRVWPHALKTAAAMLE